MRIVLVTSSLGNGLRQLVLCGFPLPRESLRLGDLGWGHPLGERITSLSGSGFSLCGREVVPHMGLDKVLEHPPALDIHQPKFGTSQRIFLLRRLIKPEQRHSVALRSPLSVEIHRAEVGLGSRVPLLCALFKPLLRLLIVLGDTLAFVIQQTELVLSRCVASFGRCTEFVCRCLVFGAHIHRRVHGRLNIGASGNGEAHDRQNQRNVKSECYAPIATHRSTSVGSYSGRFTCCRSQARGCETRPRRHRPLFHSRLGSPRPGSDTNRRAARIPGTRGTGSPPIYGYTPDTHRQGRKYST